MADGGSRRDESERDTSSHDDSIECSQPTLVDRRTDVTGSPNDSDDVIEARLASVSVRGEDCAGSGGFLQTSLMGDVTC